MDHRCYEELLNERKNMELTYEERIAHLQDQHTEVRIYPDMLDTVWARQQEINYLIIV